MYRDILTRFSDDQVINAAAANGTTTFDSQQDRNLGVGEPMAVTFDVTAKTGAGGPINGIVETSSASNFSGAKTLATVDLNTDAAPSSKTVFLPKDNSVDRYIRVRYTGGAGNRTVTVTADLVPAKFVEAYTTYPRNYEVL